MGGGRGWPRNNRVALRKCSVSSKIYDERSRKETDAPVEHRVGLGAPSKTRVGVGGGGWGGVMDGTRGFDVGDVCGLSAENYPMVGRTLVSDCSRWLDEAVTAEH